jgi:formylglycine-generating enzyme required for sulfatase activity
MERDLVTADYLSPYPENPVPAVSAVSWYAAEAYCRWLSEQLPTSFAGWEARLPTETEWEYAAKFAGAQGDITDLFGGFWEWCVEPYAPLNFFPGGAAGTRNSLLERAVRGGSWINPPGTVGAETRASLPPAFCSPFVSFRPVIAPEPAVKP